MEITSLYVYPLKGAAPIALTRARLDAFGIEHDRRWMIIDARGMFVTQREHPRLGRIGVAVDATDIVLHSETTGVLRVPLQPTGHGGRVTVQVWNDVVTAWDCGAEAAAFASEHLGFDARIVYMPASTHRQADLEFASVGDRVSFADGFPLLLIGEGSLEELNARLEQPIPMMRFRPNVVVSGTRPHEEDSWRRIVLGDVPCDVVKPCARCPVTTIDQQTSTSGKEPLRTLATYRRRNNKVWFGQNVVHRAEGSIRVGDVIEVLTTGTARPPLAQPDQR